MSLSGSYATDGFIVLELLQVTDLEREAAERQRHPPAQKCMDKR